MENQKNKPIHRYHLSKTIKVTVDYVVDAPSIDIAEQDDKFIEALAEQLEKAHPHLEYSFTNGFRFTTDNHWTFDLTHGKKDVYHSCDDEDCVGAE
tara:strand:+ start:546 stop:833 length:288 start_codon:yes stop_codon:yes gene_type:complete